MHNSCFPTAGPHYDTNAEAAGRTFVRAAHTAYYSTLQELILSKQPTALVAVAPAAPTTTLEVALLHQVLSAIQSIQGAAALNSIASTPVPQLQLPETAPAQGNHVGSGVLLQSLRLTAAMTFADFYNSFAGAMEHYSKLPSGSKEKYAARRLISKRRVVFEWIRSCLLHENSWSLPAAWDFMEQERCAVMPTRKAIPLGLFVESVGRAIVCKAGSTNMEGVVGGRRDLYGTLHQFRDGFLVYMNEYCQQLMLPIPSVPSPEAMDFSSDAEEDQEDDEEC